MQITRNKTKSVTIAYVLMLTVTAMLTAMPIQAQVEYENMQSSGSIPLPAGVTPDVTLETLSRLSFRPNPIGVGQELLINMWVSPYSFGARYLTGFRLTITDPDGNDDVINTESRGSDFTAYLIYLPDQVGTWKLKFDFLGGYFPAGNYTFMLGTVIGMGTVQSVTESLYYEPSSSGTFDLTVQQEPVASWPEGTWYPSDYWTQPVSPENRRWASILGYYPETGATGPGVFGNWPDNTNYYMSNYRYIPYVTAPSTAHIVWRRQDSISGLKGAVFGTQSWGSGANTPDLIYAGRIYNSITQMVDGKPTNVWRCSDLRTGEVYWERVGWPAPTMIIYEGGWTGVGGVVEESRGIMAGCGSSSGIYGVYVGGGRFIEYDLWMGTVATTGRATRNVTIAPLTSGTLYSCESGWPFFLSVQNMGAGNYRLINWTVAGTYKDSMSVIDYGMRVLSNVSWPISSLPRAIDYKAGIALQSNAIYRPATGDPVDSAYQPGTLIRRSGQGVPIDYDLIAIDLKTGTVLWNHTAGVGYPFISSSTQVADHGLFAAKFEDGYFYAWDLETGVQKWVSDLSSYPWGIFPAYSVSSYGGMIIEPQYDGVAAYNWTNGKLVWLYEAEAPYPFETPYQENYPFFAGCTIADGKVYAYNTEHSVTQPVTRGWRLHCIDAYTGKGIWNITGSMAPGAIADGYLTASNSYDGYMYVFGKGPSATTVTVSSKTVPNGSSVLIEGTVLDQSPAQPGTPCVSKESMTVWMESLHMQKELPSDYKVTGVPVALFATRSDGTVINIGTVASDTSGFSHAWTPPDEDVYTISAVFFGDDSYGSSSAQTHVLVTTAPEEPVTPAAQEDIDQAVDSLNDSFTPMFLGIIVAVAVAIVIGLVNLFWKRK